MITNRHCSNGHFVMKIGLVQFLKYYDSYITYLHEHEHLE